MTRTKVLIKGSGQIFKKIPADTTFHPCAASSGFTLHSSLTHNPSTALFYSNTESMEVVTTLSHLQAFVWGSHTFKMHTCTCSHLLLLTYASRNTHVHISTACGWHPQCCETSCIPHAYITPFPPPPADHSSFYPAFARALSLSLSLIENRSGWRPLLLSKICVAHRAS